MNYVDALTLLEKQFKSQYARWSDLAWKHLSEAIVPELIANLKSQLNEAELTLLLESYLSLAAKAIARGFLFPHKPLQFQNFYSLAWEKLLPEWLKHSSSLKEKVTLMANLWNLAESLAEQPAWVEALLIQGLIDSNQYSDISVVLQNIETRVLSSKGQKLIIEQDLASFDYRNVDLTDDHFFVPEKIELTAPSLISLQGKLFEGSENVDKYFYVLVDRKLQVYSAHQNLKIENQNLNGQFQKTIKNIVDSVGLSPISYVVGEDFIAVIFEGSGRLHLWRLISPNA